MKYISYLFLLTILLFIRCWFKPAYPKNYCQEEYQIQFLSFSLKPDIPDEQRIIGILLSSELYRKCKKEVSD